MDAGLDEFVYQRFILQESLFAVGRDDQRLNTLIRHGLHQLGVEFVHSDTHQYLVLHLTVVGDEALQVESCRILVPDMLGDGDAAILDAIDIGVFRMDALDGHVVDGLHADAHQPQQEGCEDRCQQDVDGCQV